MATTTTVDTIIIKNTSAQMVPIFVQPRPLSPIYKPQGGYAQIQVGAALEVENDRVDIASLRQISNNQLIDLTYVQRVVTVVHPGGTES